MRYGLRYLLLVAVLFLAVTSAGAQGGRQGTITVVAPNTPVAVDSTFDVVVLVNTGTVPIDAAAAFVRFDPAVFRVERVSPGTALPILLQSLADNEAGVVSFAAGQFAPHLPGGTFPLMTITLRALAPADAALLTLDPGGPLAMTDMLSGGMSMMASATGALVMVTDNPALLPEDPTAPRERAAGTVEIGGIYALDGGPAEAAFVLETAAVPFSASAAQAYAWEAGGGWTPGDGAYVVAASNTAALRLLVPVSLAGLSDAAVTLTYRLAAQAAQARLEMRTNLNGNWSTIAVMPPAADWTAFAVGLRPYLGQAVQFRFVWDGANAAAGDAWAVQSLSVTGAPALVGEAVPVQPSAVMPQVLPEGDGG